MYARMIGECRRGLDSVKRGHVSCRLYTNELRRLAAQKLAHEKPGQTRIFPWPSFVSLTSQTQIMSVSQIVGMFPPSMTYSLPVPVTTAVLVKARY